VRGRCRCDPAQQRNRPVSTRTSYLWRQLQVSTPAVLQQTLKHKNLRREHDGRDEPSSDSGPALHAWRRRHSVVDDTKPDCCDRLRMNARLASCCCRSSALACTCPVAFVS